MRSRWLAAIALVATVGISTQEASATVIAVSQPIVARVPALLATLASGPRISASIAGHTISVPTPSLSGLNASFGFTPNTPLATTALNAINTALTLFGGDTVQTLHATGNVDPFLNFSLGVTDNGAPSTFTFAFSIPLSPTLTGPVSVHSTLGVTLTNAARTTASIAPAAGNSFIELNNIGNCAAGVDAGTGFTFAQGPTESFDEVGTFTPTAGCDASLTTFISFTGAGGGTTYALTGGFDVSPIPEPLTMTLFGSAVLGTVGVARRRRA